MQAEQPHKKHSLRGGKRVLASETERSESDLVTASSQSRLLYQPIKGDGRCLFRAIAVGLAHRRGVALRAQQEQEEADRLRMAVADALCRSPERRASFPEAMTAVKAEGVPLRTYCKKLIRPDFWGGEAEISTVCTPYMIPFYPFPMVHDTPLHSCYAAALVVLPPTFVQCSCIDS